MNWLIGDMNWKHGIGLALVVTIFVLYIGGVFSSSPAKAPEAPTPALTYDEVYAYCKEVAVSPAKLEACVNREWDGKTLTMPVDPAPPEPGFVPCKPGPTLQACLRRAEKEGR
jgi:hypothetical protein